MIVVNLIKIKHTILSILWTTSLVLLMQAQPLQAAQDTRTEREMGTIMLSETSGEEDDNHSNGEAQERFEERQMTFKRIARKITSIDFEEIGELKNSITGFIQSQELAQRTEYREADFIIFLKELAGEINDANSPSLYDDFKAKFQKMEDAATIKLVMWYNPLVEELDLQGLCLSKF